MPEVGCVTLRPSRNKATAKNMGPLGAGKGFLPFKDQQQ